MENTKPVQVVMLPTNDNYISQGALFQYENGKIDIASYEHGRIEKWKPQHLYFISNDELEENSKVIYSYEAGGQEYEAVGTITKMNGKYPKEIDNIIPITTCTRPIKIIASTDPSLGLPAVPLIWIRDVYVPSNGSIKEVMLEQEVDLDNPPEGYFVRYGSGKYWEDDPVLVKRLSTNPDREPNYKSKLTPNNEVVIVESDSDKGYKKFLNNPEEYIEKTRSTKIIDQELEDAAKKAYPINPVKLNNSLTIDVNLLLRRAFNKGAVWQAQKSADDVIQFAKWINENGWWSCEPMWCNGEDKNYTELTSTQLYDLWQQNKNK